MLRLFAIDPGLRLTGYALLERSSASRDPALVEAGVIRLTRRPGPDHLERRLGELDAELAELFDRLAPTHLAVEKLYAHYRHPRTAILMGHARGVILLAAVRRGISIEHLPSTEVKKSVTGNGHASKAQIQQAVCEHFELERPPSPPDVADAIAIGLCGASRVG